MRFFGHTVDVWFCPDEGEVERRACTGLDPITEPETLRTLMALPTGLPVPLAEIHPLDRMVLEHLAFGVIEIDAGMVTRQAIPPVNLTGLVIHASGWEDVQAASLLRTHAPRLVVATAALARRILREADPDIGVAIQEGSGLVVERPPGRRWLKVSWQRWLLAEIAFAHWISRV